MTEPATTPQLLRIPRTAEILGRSVRGTYDLINRGELTHVRVAGSVRVPYDALMRYIAAHTVPAQSEAGETVVSR